MMMMMMMMMMERKDYLDIVPLTFSEFLQALMNLLVPLRYAT